VGRAADKEDKAVSCSDAIDWIEDLLWCGSRCFLLLQPSRAVYGELVICDIVRAHQSSPLDDFVKGWHVVIALESIIANLSASDVTLAIFRTASLKGSFDGSSLFKIDLLRLAVNVRENDLERALHRYFWSLLTAILVANLIDIHSSVARADTQNVGTLARLSIAGLSTFIFADAGSVGLSNGVSSAELTILIHQREAISQVTDITL
jgi:hypothetical protein